MYNAYKAEYDRYVKLNTKLFSCVSMLIATAWFAHLVDSIILLRYNFEYSNLPINGASPKKGAPIVWRKPMLSYFAKINIVSLKIVWFSIRNHRWIAENLSFHPKLYGLTRALGALITSAEYSIFTHLFSPGVGVLEGCLYAVGGHDGPLVRKSVEVYTPETNSWVQVADMHLCRRNAGKK